MVGGQNVPFHHYKSTYSLVRNSILIDQATINLTIYFFFNHASAIGISVIKGSRDCDRVMSAVIDISLSGQNFFASEFYLV